MAGHIRTTGCTVDEARVAIKDVQGRQWGELRTLDPIRQAKEDLRRQR